jgi:hypothetical protein
MKVIPKKASYVLNLISTLLLVMSERYSPLFFNFIGNSSLIDNDMCSMLLVIMSMTHVSFHQLPIAI